MDHGVLAFESPPQQRGVADISHDAFLGNRIDALGVGRGTDQHPDRVAGCVQQPHHHRPDETIAAGDKDLERSLRADRKSGLSGGIAQRHHCRRSDIHIRKSPPRHAQSARLR